MPEKINNKKKIKSFLMLQLINFGIDLFLIFIFCAVCVSADAKPEYMFYIALILMGVCSFVAGFTAGIKERKNGMVKGLINGLPFNIIIIFVSLIMNGFRADLNILLTLLIGLLFSAVGGIVSVNIRLKK